MAKKELLQIKISSAFKARIERAAAHEQTNMSELIRRATLLEVRRIEAEGNGTTKPE